MEFSQIYSVVSGFNTDDKESLRKVEEIVNSLQKFRKISDVKNFLSEKYHITDGTRKFYISNTVPVLIDETEKSLSIEINVTDKYIIYSYSKGV